MRFARPVSFNALQHRGMMHRWHFMHFTVLSLCLCVQGIWLTELQFSVPHLHIRLPKKKFSLMVHPERHAYRCSVSRGAADNLHARIPIVCSALQPATRHGCQITQSGLSCCCSHELCLFPTFSLSQ